MAPRGGKKAQHADGGSAASSEAPWPIPGALEGMKSRKKPLFKVDEADCSLSLTLDSRVLALGEAGQAGQALLPLLLEPAAASGVTAHPNLGVVHLGPHLAGATASTAEHRAAVARALGAKPQVVLLEERLADGGLAWVEAFHALLRGSALRTFKGALVVAACEETFLLREVCTERWVESSSGKIRQEAISSKLQIVREISVTGAAMLNASPSRKRGGGRGGDEGPGELVWAASALFVKEFEGDLFDEMAEHEHMKVSLLTQTGEDGIQQLLGLMAYEVYPAPRAEVYIHRIAVQSNSRGKGYGRILMQWLMEEAARVPKSQCDRITCSALDKVVSFYKKAGFKVEARPEEHNFVDEDSSDDDADPQTFMALPNASLVGEVA